MVKPTVYRWDDTDAPVLSGAAGTLITVLTKCLVDGYGSKSGAGWTKDFKNAADTIATFKNSAATGKGVSLLVDDTTTKTAKIKGYELMTAIDVGVGNFLSGTTSYSVDKSTLASSVARAWILIATDNFFYLAIRYIDPIPLTDKPIATSLICFGDFLSTNVEGFNSLIGFSNVLRQSVTGFGKPSPPLSNNAGLSSSRPIAGTAGTPTNLWTAWGGPAYFTPGNAAQSHEGPAYSGQLFLTRPVIGDGNTVNVRGFLPGLFIPCHNYDAFTFGRNSDRYGEW